MSKEKKPLRFSISCTVFSACFCVAKSFERQFWSNWTSWGKSDGWRGGRLLRCEGVVVVGDVAVPVDMALFCVVWFFSLFFCVEAFFFPWALPCKRGIRGEIVAENGGHLQEKISHRGSSVTKKHFAQKTKNACCPTRITDDSFRVIIEQSLGVW